MARPIRRWTGSLAVALGVVGLCSARAQSPPVNPQFGMIGLAEGQTLRLNLVAYPPNPCSAAIGFLNHNGGVPQPDPSRTVNLQAGQADFVDLSASSLGIQPGGRREFQPVVSLIPQSDPTVQNACNATVELFTSATGASQVGLPQPQPDMPNIAPQFGMVGIALGQTLRLNVVAFPPNPCVATIGFLTSTGAPSPVANKTVSLAPNQSDFVDLTAEMLGLQAGDRADLLPAVMLPSAASGVSTCQATAEVFATNTGRTRILLNPQPLPPRKTPQ